LEAKNFEDYDGPTLLLIRHSEITPGNVSRMKAPQKTYYVCGGFTKTPWKDEQKHTGSWETVVFTLTPRFRLYTPRPDGNQNFSFLNTKPDSKIGLGFGGNEDGNYKLWIDENIAAGSYTTENDGTFVKGALVEPNTTKLNVSMIMIIPLTFHLDWTDRSVGISRRKFLDQETI